MRLSAMPANTAITQSPTDADTYIPALCHCPVSIILAVSKEKAEKVVALNILNARGGIVEAVGTQYLAALADEAQIANHQSLAMADEEVLRQATLSPATARQSGDC